MCGVLGHSTAGGWKGMHPFAAPSVLSAFTEAPKYLRASAAVNHLTPRYRSDCPNPKPYGYTVLGPGRPLQAPPCSRTARRTAASTDRAGGQAYVDRRMLNILCKVLFRDVPESHVRPMRSVRRMDGLRQSAHGQRANRFAEHNVRIQTLCGYVCVRWTISR
jgi:hypothetical protein